MSVTCMVAFSHGFYAIWSSNFMFFVQREERRLGGNVWDAERAGGFQELDQGGHGPRAGEDEGSFDRYVCGWDNGLVLWGSRHH